MSRQPADFVVELLAGGDVRERGAVAVTAGLPFMRYMNAAIWSRLTCSSGW